MNSQIMQRQIWKYKLIPDINGRSRISMPIDAVILNVENNNSNLCLWVMVHNYHRNNEIRTFHIAGTGHDIPDDVDMKNYIGTGHNIEGHFVFHVFEIKID